MSWCTEWGLVPRRAVCVCFNVVLSLLGLQYKVEGIKRWLQGRYQTGFSFCCPGKTVRGQNWQRWRNLWWELTFHFVFRDKSQKYSKIMLRFLTFLHIQYLSFLLVLMLKPGTHLFSCWWGLLLNSHYTSIYNSERLWLIPCAVFSNICLQCLDILYSFLMCYKT